MGSKQFELLKITNSDGDLVDLELYFFTEVLKFRSLHHGYWRNGAELTIDNLKRAQEAYTESLLELIPEDVTTVLDVGCGMGDNALAMSQRGLSVTAISPDAEHEKFVSNIENINYHCTTFERYRGDAPFDLILMSESQNYFDREAGLAQCRNLLRTGGYLLISGMFRRDATAAFDDINQESEYIEAAERFGLKLKRSLDITDRTIPTIRLAQKTYADHVQPALKLVDHYLNATTRWKMAALRVFFRKQFRHLGEINSWINSRVDPDHFERHVKYARLLFQISEEAGGRT